MSSPAASSGSASTGSQQGQSLYQDRLTSTFCFLLSFLVHVLPFLSSSLGRNPTCSLSKIGRGSNSSNLLPLLFPYHPTQPKLTSPPSQPTAANSPPAPLSPQTTKSSPTAAVRLEPPSSNHSPLQSSSSNNNNNKAAAQPGPAP